MHVSYAPRNLISVSVEMAKTPSLVGGGEIEGKKRPLR
jgi:hypothetical protein